MGLLWWIKLMLVFAALGLSSVATELRAASNVTTANDGICQSIDIRSNINAFEKLRGCRVIEGNLHILLISQLDESYYNNITFPELREITGFFLLYRVDGLKTLSKMFPNLAVIRGQKLLFNHAFAIYEMRGLTDIGLVSLTHIVRGAVHISKNPNLCYANTIDWDRIAKQGKEDNYIAQNKADNECLLCPGDDKKTSETESHQSECPMMPHSPGRHLCWNTNKTSCQKICPDDCEACNSKGECCSDMCLSGCDDDNKNNCFVCRYMSMGPRCVKHCPHNTVLFMDRRCVSEDDCRKIPKPKELDISNMYPHKPFNGACVLDCPPNYSEEKVNEQWECNECKGTCPKKCQARKVDSIYAAQMLRGCTYIEGPLEIQIVGGGRNIVKELHDNLKEITEIEGYLKVTRSYPLVSLTFLKNLKVIHGTQLESNKFSVVVLDNPNLEDLFDFNLTRVHVRTGRLFFHFNPKLCFDKIEQFRIYAKMNETSGTEVDRKSNGEKTACNVTLLDVYVEIKSDVSVVLSWKPFRMDEYRHLLGYVIYVRDSPKQNLSLYDSRDACGTDGWQVYDYRNGNEEAVDFLYYPLTLLKPYTQYAFYVKTYTISTEQTGAQSKIQYFRTYPGKPSQVLNLRVHSNFSNELVINWQPPLKPNGNLTKYRITVKLEPDDPNFLEQRNYCREPLIAVKQPEVIPNKVTTSTKSDDVDVCPCRDEGEKSEPKFGEKDALSHMTFEDQLHNLVYVKRYDPSSTRQKRDVLETTASPDVTEPPSMTNSDENIYYSSPNETVYVIRELQHFSEYTVTVQACRESISTNESAKNCSDESIYNARTLPKPNADDITFFRTAVQKLNQSLRLEWNEPTSPNGLILTYQIEYTRLNIENSKPTVICITRKAYVDAGKVYVLKNLASGNYSVRLMATSLNGNGAHTDYKYFYIEAEGSSHVFEIVFGGVVGSVVLLGLVLGYIYWLRGGFQRDVPNMKLIASVNPEYVSTAYVPDEWEVPRKKIELVRELGQGSFGMVYEGIARDVVKGHPEMRCAIKTVNEHATDRERVEFLNEASVMKAFDTGHVVRLLGVVSQGQPTLVVMELMSNGDLKSYLRSHRPEEQDSLKRESPPSLKRILQMAIEIADGMAYLTAKKFVHRDLAARNCMVSDNLTVKIGDFGMTRDIYETDYYRKGTKGLLPVRWMAPESLKDGVFTSSSDVWSYGVVLWEMATLASQPYQGLSNDQVLRYVIDGGVMERPENCPDKLYDLMRLCWQHKPSIRPSFLELEGTLLSESHDEFRKVAFYFSKSGEEARQAAQAVQQQDEAEVTTPLRPTRPDDDDFDLDSCSDGHDETDDDAALTEGRRVSFQTPQYRTAAYRDTAGPSLLPSPPQANGYVSSRPGNNGTGNVEMTEC